MLTGKRDLKKPVSIDLIKIVKKTIKPYGAGRALAARAGVDYETIRTMITKRKATQATIDSVSQAIQSLTELESAA